MALTQSETSLFLLLLLFSSSNVASVTFLTLRNRCSFTVWPGILTDNGTTVLGSGVYPLMPGLFFQLVASPGWSGRIWGRTGCIFNGDGNGKCATGDCTGGLRCTGRGAPPVTVAKFIIGTLLINDKDLYEVSIAEGYNVGVGVRATGGTGYCQYAECSEMLMKRCSITCTCSYPNYVITFCPDGSF